MNTAYISENILIFCFEYKGRSMGSRAAVGVANAVKGTELDGTVAGVIALSYPLHTKENKTTLRDGPLYETYLYVL